MSAVIVTPISEIERMVTLEIIRVSNHIFPPLAGKIKRDIVANIGDIFSFSPEYQSIISGDLSINFGIPSGEAQQKLKVIVETLARSTMIDFIPLRQRAKQITGGFRISAFQSDFADILSLAESYQKTDKGQQLPWLEWLLLEGDRVIISEYFFLPGSFKQSRTGGGIMAFDTLKHWRVPPQYSGTVRNNWITRTVTAYIDDIGIIIEQAIKKHL